MALSKRFDAFLVAHATNEFCERVGRQMGLAIRCERVRARVGDVNVATQTAVRVVSAVQHRQGCWPRISVCVRRGPTPFKVFSRPRAPTNLGQLLSAASPKSTFDICGQNGAGAPGLPRFFPDCWAAFTASSSQSRHRSALSPSRTTSMRRAYL